MANQYEDDEDDMDLDTEVQSDGPANLRKALKRAEKEKKELADQLATIQSDLRNRSVKEVLATKGVPDKVAKFIPGDVSTPEQVDAWLTENADVFGFAPSNTETAPTDAAQAANNAAYQRINAANQNASTPSRDADLMSKVNGAKTLDELNALTGQISQRRR